MRVTNPVLRARRIHDRILITQSSYSASLEKSEKDTGYMLDAYLKDPTIENLHGLRTATRRMLTIIKLAPRKAREGKTTRLIERFQSLLSLTRKARHLDIVLSRIPAPDQNKALDGLVRSLRRKRDSSIETVKRIAASIKNPSTGIQGKELTDAGLTKRFNQSANELKARIQKVLPAVKDGSVKQKQLHRLRQDSRKLRYLLELSGDQESSDRLSLLKTWQELLASIHDDDACTRTLESKKKIPQVKAVLDEVQAERTQNYEKFRQVLEDRPLFSQNKAVIAQGNSAIP